MTRKKTSIERAIDPDKIDTLEKARAYSLSKWAEVRGLTTKLFDEIDTRCGFCYWVDTLTGGRFCCSECLVHEYCDRLQRRMAELRAELIDEIDRTISFIKQVKENDN